MTSALLEQFQEKCAAVFRPELRRNKEIEHFHDSKNIENALAGCCKTPTGRKMVHFDDRKATENVAYVQYAPLFLTFSRQNILIFGLG